MDTVVLMVLSFAGYLLAYRFYGRFLGRKIFGISDVNTPPSKAREDGEDYVPTKKGVVFGHHYTSIAGTGPIVGPAVGVIWGWVPAFIWVFAGSILMGAVHDLGALVVSLRNDGESISECAGRLVGKRVRNIFYVIIFLELLIVISIFCLVIALIFAMYPGSVLPVWLQIPIAVALGFVVYKCGGGLVTSTAVAVIAMYGTVLLGDALPFAVPTAWTTAAHMPATGIWAIILLIYAFVASILPVTTLLQPRDYINAWQLFIAMGLITLGAFSAGLFHGMGIVAPAFNLNPEGAPAWAPFLFITIACGAISGFHSLVSSGTTAKQLEKESDALPVGYGSMLLESVLAMLVIVAVSAGIGMGYKGLSGVDAWNAHYASWQAAAGGLGAKLQAFVAGSANMIETLGVPRQIAKIVIGVFIASFAGTTLDTATRLQRYIVAEFFKGVGFKRMGNKYAATFVAVATAGALTFISGADGKGALNLWPMFGAVNQLLAALGLLVVSVYLKREGGAKHWVTSIPCVFMLGMTLWAVASKEMDFIEKKNFFLAAVNGITGIMALWMAVESIRVFFANKRGGENGDGETAGTEAV